MGAALQRDLVLQRDPVAEQQHVHAGAERLVRLERRVLAGHRDDGQVGLRARQAARRPRARRRPAPPPDGARVEDLLGGGEAGLGAAPRSTAITRSSGPAPSIPSSGSPIARGLLAVGRRRHEAGGALDPVHALGRAGGGHHLGAVGPAAGAHPDRRSRGRHHAPLGAHQQRLGLGAERLVVGLARAQQGGARPPSTSTAPGRRWMNGDAWAIAYAPVWPIQTRSPTRSGGSGTSRATASCCRQSGPKRSGRALGAVARVGGVDRRALPQHAGDLGDPRVDHHRAAARGGRPPARAASRRRGSGRGRARG